MKRIVHITCVHNAFDGRIMYRECAWLAKSGYEVILIAPALFQEKVKENVRIIGLKKPGSRFKRPFAWLEILKKVLELKPDILHFHDPELLVILPFVRLFSGKKTKLVYDVHEYLVDSIRDKFWIPEKMRPIAARLVQQAEYFLGSFVDGQIFVVKGQTKFYSKWRTKKMILHNYPDLEKFDYLKQKKYQPEKRIQDIFKLNNKKENSIILIYIGSLYERRGIMTMLKTLKILVSKGFKPLLVLGGIFEDKSFKNKVKKYIREHNIEQNVRITGWIDYKKIKDYLACADAVWLPHPASEQYTKDSVSTKQLEAMLASLPVICSDLPPLKRFIDEAECGLTVDPADPLEHAKAVIWLCENPEEAKQMGKRGRILVMEKYSWQKEFKNFKDFYVQMLK